MPVTFNHRKLKVSLKPLLQERDRLTDQMMKFYDQAEAIGSKIAGLDLAISILEKGDKQETPKAAGPATNVKALLIDFARECAAAGLNANIAVEMAAKRNIDLKRGTAASNLSRLKADNALVHDGKRYRLPEFVRTPQLQLAVHTGGKGS